MPSNVILDDVTILQIGVTTVKVGGITRLDVSAFYDSNGVKVVGTQVGDPGNLAGNADLPTTVTKVNDILSALRSHGLIG